LTLNIQVAVQNMMDYFLSGFVRFYDGVSYLTSNTYSSISSSFVNLFEKTGNLAIGAYNSVYLYSINYKASVIEVFNGLFK